MIVRSHDDIAVGLTQSDSLGDFNIDERTENEFSFDTGMLADGKYFLSIALFQSDNSGNSIILDHVTGAISFHVIAPPDDKNPLVWESRWWGSVHFPNLVINNRTKGEL